MAVKVKQTIQFGKNALYLELMEDGTVVITCANKVKLRFPYIHEKDGAIKFTSDVEETGDFLEVEVSPNDTWDFEIGLCDSGSLLPRKEFTLVLEVKPEGATIYAQDGIGSWLKQFKL